MTGLPNEMKFGIAEYRVPQIISSKPFLSTGKAAKIGFVETVKKEQSWKPGCKNQHEDWSKSIKLGKPSKTKKETFIDQVMKCEFKKKAGPATYSTEKLKLKRALGAYNLKDKLVNFTEEARWQSM